MKLVRRRSLLYHRFILKTCGTTTPLQCINDLVRIVKKYAGFDIIEVVRKKREKESCNSS